MLPVTCVPGCEGEGARGPLLLIHDAGRDRAVHQGRDGRTDHHLVAAGGIVSRELVAADRARDRAVAVEGHERDRAGDGLDGLVVRAEERGELPCAEQGFGPETGIVLVAFAAVLFPAGVVMQPAPSRATATIAIRTA